MITALVVYQIAKELSKDELEKLQLLLQQDVEDSYTITSNKKKHLFTDKQALDYLFKNTFNCK
jgi:hypothetical protein